MVHGSSSLVRHEQSLWSDSHEKRGFQQTETEDPRHNQSWNRAIEQSSNRTMNAIHTVQPLSLGSPPDATRWTSPSRWYRSPNIAAFHCLPVQRNRPRSVQKGTGVEKFPRCRYSGLTEPNVERAAVPRLRRSGRLGTKPLNAALCLCPCPCPCPLVPR
jgi:hypothetical protein